MDEAWLAAQLAAGRSIEAVAREVGRDPSTVAYWVNKYGLVSAHAAQHAAHGGIAGDVLRELVERGLSTRQIAAERSVSQATVRRWLKLHGLQTAPLHYRSRGLPPPSAALRQCSAHGWTEFRPVGAVGTLRCPQCANEAVSRRRRRVKEILVSEAGGACRICGYSRYPGALQFHHLEPAAKAFSIGGYGWARALASCRAEVAKCVLLCANCHAEVEAGMTELP